MPSVWLAGALQACAVCVELGLGATVDVAPGSSGHAGYVARSSQLTEARGAEAWLRTGSQTVQQQALRDLDQAWRNFYAGTHGRPSWRREGVHEGFRIVGQMARRVEKLNRKWGRVLVPKVGWVKFRLSRKLSDAKSYRITRDRAGRWHIAFAVVPEPTQAPASGDVVGVDRGVIVSVALSTGELLYCPGLSGQERRRNADVNAAINIARIAAAGRAVDARGETAVPVSEKREPQHAPPMVA